MTPLFFGPGSSPLYGVYHPPKGDARDHGVVLCNAFGQEYMRAHRAYRQLAMLLTRKGFHVLRFDYRGTGDSSGDLEGVTAEDWLTDIGHAIDELRDSAGVSQVSLVGLRLGAVLAAGASLIRTDLERLVLWDPVRSGPAYERELIDEIAREQPSEYAPAFGNGESPTGGLVYNGFEMTRSLRESLRLLQVDVAGRSTVRRLAQVVSHENEVLFAIRQQLQVHPGFEYRFTEAPHDWNYVDTFGGILLPQPVIQTIVQWMEAR
jgi:pimeloyl-ACP methyl ester carboxylesterase